MSQSFNQSGRRLGYAVLFFVLCTILVVTLEPFQFRVPRHFHLIWWDGSFDVYANIALFMIPGFVYALARQAATGIEDQGERRKQTLRRAFLFGALMSGSIEAIQEFEPARYSSLTDVMSNTTGAVLGAWTFLRISHRFRSGTPIVGRLALELPLMGLVYLLVPLCMLASLTLPHAALAPYAYGLSFRAVGLLALACFMGTLLGHVQRNRFGPQRLVRPLQTAAAAAGSFALGALPAIATDARLVVVGAALAAGIAWIIGAVHLTLGRPANRRFEAAALRHAAPFFLCYLALASLTMPTIASWNPSKGQILGAVESYAAFTVFGFLLAEGWGRLELRYRWVVAYVGSVCLAVACGTRVLQHVPLFTVTALLGQVTRSLAGAYGGWIYHLQRAYIRSLVGERKERATAEPANQRMQSAA